MYYKDLTPFEYNSAYTGLNIGWLNGSHSFPTGDPSEGFLDLLFATVSSGEYTRCAASGFHVCEICHRREVIAQLDGKEIVMGNTEIAIPFDGVEYVAPSLIYHYVKLHRYLPPDPFIKGVMATA